MRSSVVIVLAFAVGGCSTNGNDGACATPGGPVSGAPDQHCVAPDGGAIAQPVSENACHPDAGPDGGATTDGSPLLGGQMAAETFLNLTHASPTPYVTATEGPPGTYVTGPITFDAPGKWTVRFHFREDCEDLTADSPHGHAAFFVEVP